MPDSTVSRQNPRQCPECGALLRPGALRGLCSRCLVTRALSHRDRAAREHEAMLDVPQVASAFTDFDVREMIGRGGMGAVYAAWQKSLERLVALKVLSPALLSSEDFLDRFQREARVMAQLDHPNIARVFDSGLTESGEPFIVMELIRGEPITHFAARQSLTLQQRLELFRGACAGVHHAHLKGVVHRDIKPSNVLVTDQDGRWAPKVIDFGLARSHDRSAQGGADWETLYHLLGTPAYMSPEQAGGTSASIDTRSDIYSLGALLYELLTEMPPFDEEALRGGASENLRETLVGLPIRQPSDRAAESRPVVSQEGPRETRRPVWADALRGDLDAIVLKRLAKDPSQRYQTVAALMDDLDRFTLHEPVTAMEATVAYRLRKFLRRYRLAVAGTLLVFLLLAGGSTLLFLESLQTRRAERLAAQRLKQGEDLIDFMLGDLYTKLDTLGRLDVLDSALGSVEQFYAESAGPKLAPNRLAHRAHARRLFGLVRSARGQTEVARSNYVESIQLYHAALSTQPAHSVWLEGLSQAWNNLAVSYHSVLSVGEAEAAYQQALEFNGRALALEPTTANWIDTRASILHNLAALQEATSRLNDATKNYGAALDLWNKLLASRTILVFWNTLAMCIKIWLFSTASKARLTARPRPTTKRCACANGSSSSTPITCSGSFSLPISARTSRTSTSIRDNSPKPRHGWIYAVRCGNNWRAVIRPMFGGNRRWLTPTAIKPSFWQSATKTKRPWRRIARRGKSPSACCGRPSPTPSGERSGSMDCRLPRQSFRESLIANRSEAIFPLRAVA